MSRHSVYHALRSSGAAFQEHILAFFSCSAAGAEVAATGRNAASTQASCARHSLFKVKYSSSGAPF